jgi:beta-N-acetylhexosaminidase
VSPLSLRQAAGQVLVVGLEGTQLSAVETAWLRLLQPCGVILFRRNIESPAQTHALLRSVVGPQLRCIDVEGGTVDRLRDSIAPMPSAFAVAATNEVALFEQHGTLIGQEVSMLGLNVTFAPVLDLRTPDSEPVMTTRVVGDSRLAARYASSFLKGLKQQSVLGCGKHFPGLGSGQVDSHHATPVITKPLNLLWKEDLLPYRQLMKRLPMVMISHASYPAAVPEPASISGYWIREVLIKELGYQGLIVSDDMEMGGILKYTGMPEAAIASIAAGTHIVEICRDPALIFTAYEALLREAESSPAFARLLRGAASKVKDIKTKPMPPAPTDTAVEKMRTAVERFREQVVKAGGA